MSKHTPGPWRVIDGYYPCFREIEGPSFKISVVMSATDISFDESMRREADARLIAAAPELLEALTAMMTNPHLHLGDLVYQVREREGLGWDGPSVKAWSDAVTAARAAIAKATGES